MATRVRTQVIDSDAHVEEWAETFSEKYLDARYAARRPAIVAAGTRAYWLIDDRVWPQMVGPGCMIFGTPTGFGHVETKLAKDKPETFASQELREGAARLKDMDREGIDLQVLYPTLFVGYPLTADPNFYHALCQSYNNWIADATRDASGRLRWVAVCDLGNANLAAAEVHRVKELGAVGVMILGTVGEHQLYEEEFDPFFSAMEAAGLPVCVHVGWSCPPLTQMFSSIFESAMFPFNQPVYMAFASIVAGGILDRHPRLKIGFFEVGVSWVPYYTERLQHWWSFSQRFPLGYRAKLAPQEYLRSGNVFFTCEVDERLLPEAIAFVGENQVMFASDIPHADREEFAARELLERGDLSDAVKQKILATNTLRFYNL